MSNQQTNNRPVHTIRHGKIKATIWANQTQKGLMYNVTVVRSYQDEEQNWHDTQSFGVQDLMIVAKAVFDAHTWISTQKAGENGSTEQNEGRGKRNASRQTA